MEQNWGISKEEDWAINVDGAGIVIEGTGLFIGAGSGD